MERITYSLLDKTLKAPDIIVCNADNDTIELAIDSTGTIYETWEKRCDLAMPDGTTDIHGFDPAVTDVIAVFTLTSAHLKKGALVINPYVQDNGARKGFPKKSVQVVSQLGNDVVNATVQVIINDYIDARIDVKEVITETLDPSFEAAAGVNAESDGLTFIFGIPRGLQGEQGNQGETGLTGNDGYTPIKGVDYFDGEVSQLSLDTQVSNLAENVGKPIGTLVMPSGFTPTLPCNFVRGSNGEITHDMDFAPYRTGTTLWFHQVTGSDASGNGSELTPYKSIGKCFDIAIAGVGDYVIRTNDTNYVNRFYGALNGAKTITEKRISVIGGSTNMILGTLAEALTWTADGANTWKATRSAVYAVFDRVNLDSNGIPTPLTVVSSVENCQATVNSWYTDGTTVWVRTSDGNTPTINTIGVGLGVQNFPVTLKEGATLYFENVDIIGGTSGDLITINADANVQGTFIAKNCKFVGGQLRISGATGNVLSINDVKNTYLFDCIFAHGSRDGVNYHFLNIPSGNRRECFVMEFNVKSYSHGKYDSNANNNATSAHEGCTILRIHCEGFNTNGPVVADVNGCYSIMFNCYMHDSWLSNQSLFLFQDAGGIVYLYDCTAGGLGNIDLYSTVVPVNIRNFRGYRFNVPYLNYI
jgi:hypothetical protein